MKRRKFLAASGLAAVAMPVKAQGSRPEIRWRMASTYQKSLGTIFGTSEVFAKRVSELTDGRFQINIFAAGELVGPIQVFDAVQNESIECGHTVSFFHIGKDPAFGFGTALPFGMNTRCQNAWLYVGGGLKLLNDFYKSYNVTMLPLGNTGAQMGGWFRKEIKSVADLRGLKMRIGGLGGMVLSKLGVVPQQVAGSDMYPALEKGVIDAVEFIGPYDDEKIGFFKIAKYYYSPGWWDGSNTTNLFIGAKAWEALPTQYRTIVETAAAEANAWMTAKYDVENPPALRRLLASGTQLRAFPRSVLDECKKAADELYTEMEKKSPAFKKIYEPWRAFRDEQIRWARICELPFDNYMANAQASK